jgi:hypothetical protein
MKAGICTSQHHKGRHIFFQKLCYIKTSEVDSRDKIAQLVDGTILTLKNLSFDRLLEILPEEILCASIKILAIRCVQAFSLVK